MHKTLFLITVILATAIFISCDDAGDSASLSDIELTRYGEQNISQIVTKTGNFSRDSSNSQKVMIPEPDVLSLVISSADIFGYEFDTDNGRWNSTCGITGSTNTYDNDEEAILIIDSLVFRTGSELESVLEQDNVPLYMDVLYFDNRWYGIQVENYIYGDAIKLWNIPEADVPLGNRYTDYSNVCDFGNGNEQFEGFDIVFINEGLFSQTYLFKEYPEAGIDDLSELEILVAQSVFDQVRNLGGMALFIPFNPATALGEELVIEVSVNNLIEYIDTDNKEVKYKSDSNGSPLTYSISGRDIE